MGMGRRLLSLRSTRGNCRPASGRGQAAEGLLARVAGADGQADVAGADRGRVDAQLVAVVAQARDAVLVADVVAAVVQRAARQSDLAGPARLLDEVVAAAVPAAQHLARTAHLGLVDLAQHRAGAVHLVLADLVLQPLVADQRFVRAGRGRRREGLGGSGMHQVQRDDGLVEDDFLCRRRSGCREAERQHCCHHEALEFHSDFSWLG